MLRISYRTIGGPFPGKGAAPEMKRDFHLVNGRASFEDFNDRASGRLQRIDFALLPANDNDAVKDKDVA